MILIIMPGLSSPRHAEEQVEKFKGVNHADRTKQTQVTATLSGVYVILKTGQSSSSHTL